MKAIVVRQFGPPDVMRVEEVPDPAPGPTQVRIRLRAAGVNPADTYVRAGAYASLPALPFTPGYDGAGIVDAVGSDVRTIAPGDRVYLNKEGPATYAEAVVCEAWQAHSLPAAVTFEQGAALGVPYATAHRALFGRAKARAGETVLVHGASGGVGSAAVQLAHARGLDVIGTAGTEKGLELVRELGALHVFNHRDPQYLTQIREVTGGRGVDVILEMLANVNLDKDLGLLGFRGRVVVVGNRGRIEIDPRQTMGKDSAILGVRLWNATTEEMAIIHGELMAGLAEGTLKPVIGQTLPLADAPESHRAVIEPGAYGKIVLIP